MKTNAHRWLYVLAAGLGLAGVLRADYIAYEVPPGAAGNQAATGVVLGNDFRVVSPITVTQLGVFNSGTNGLQAGTELNVQLYERGGRHNGTLLETLSFDAASPGTPMGGSLFKPLPCPVTLLPGNYTIAAYGFDTNSPVGDANLPPYNTTPGQVNPAPPWTVNTGGGLIEAQGLARHGGAESYPGHLDKGPANRYAAGTFIYSAGTLPAVPYAADYAALTAGVGSFPIQDTRHLGSLAVLDQGSFPILVEHGGNRQILEAAGTYAGNPNGGRVVAFANNQWEHATNDNRALLFLDALRWAARKNGPATITVGITANLGYPNTNLDLSFLTGLGCTVIPIDCRTLNLTNGLPPMDVLIVDGHARYVERIAGLVQQYAANGGGLVVSLSPYFAVYPRVRPAFTALNDILAPFGLAYSLSLATPADLSFTNLQTVPQPAEFGALTAAQLLHADKTGQFKLDSQQKTIALNTISYAVVGQPQWLTELTEVYTGITNNGIQYPGDAGSAVDVVALNGSQAATNAVGSWQVKGGSLVAQGARGIVEFNFSVPASDMYQVQIAGSRNPASAAAYDFNLALTIDGQSLGHFDLNTATNGGVLQCLLPFLSAGAHTLRIRCDNPRSYTTLSLDWVKIQTRLGPASSGGLKDWVEQVLEQQSGLDNTNSTIGSYTSPVCLEGRDPYLKLMNLYVEGADNKLVNLNPQPAPNQRWYVNVPLSAYVNSQPVLTASYQNGGLTEVRYLQWLPLNLLTPATLTIRQGDSLLLNAQPTNAPAGNLVITAGTNQWTGRTSQPIACRFNNPGTYTVTGTYSRTNVPTQTGSITVNVVGQTFADSPDSWVGRERYWDVPAVPPQALLEADARLIFEPLAALDNNGVQLGLMADQNEPRYVLSRLGTNGPVLASTKVNGFQLWSGGSTYTRVLQVYPDGSQLVEMLVILSPVLPDLTVQLNVIVAGVTFDDGTTSRTLTAASFDALGRSVVRFIRPASARTSVCHSLTVFQGTNQIYYTR